MKKGFTLVELVVAVVLIGILAALALPKITGLVVRAKCSEAVVTLLTYERMQGAYYSVNGSMGSIADLGMSLPSSGWFSYTATLDNNIDSSGTNNSNSNGKGKGKSNGNGNGTTKVAVCHTPAGNPNNAHMISIGNPAYASHVAHGDPPAQNGQCGDGSASHLTATLVASATAPMASDCLFGSGVFSQWTPDDISRGNTIGNCIRYMGAAFQQ